MGSLEQGARNAVRICMGIKPGENVLIVSDRSAASIGEELRNQSSMVTENVKLVLLEDCAPRPLKSLPENLRKLAGSWANVTFWASRSMPGELVARREFIDLAKHNARHGHMPNITVPLMEQGMCADYDNVYDLTHKIYDAARNATKIKVSNIFGTDLLIEFNPSWRWIPADGRYHTKGKWGNLPEGETFTAPMRVNGKLVTNLLGDWFSERYGNFKDSLSFNIVDSMIQPDSIRCDNTKLKGEITEYLASNQCSSRASEFALPTNPLLMSLPTIGNLLQDEKSRVHIAFGDPYPDETGAPWSCKTHVDMLLEQCDLAVDGDKIMERGMYTI
ncbi:MAG: aminopeptidase [Nitrososphaerales archaeon]